MRFDPTSRKERVFVSKNRLIIEGDLVDSLVLLLSSSATQRDLERVRAGAQLHLERKRAEINYELIGSFVNLLGGSNPSGLGQLKSIAGTPSLRSSYLRLLLHVDSIVSSRSTHKDNISVNSLVILKLQIAGLLIVSDLSSRKSIPMALHYINLAVDLSKKCNNPFLQTYCLHQKGMIKFIKMDFRGAVQSYLEAEECLSSISNVPVRESLRSAIHCDKAPALLRRGHKALSSKELASSVQAAMEAEDMERLACTYAQRGVHAIVSGRYDLARKLLNFPFSNREMVVFGLSPLLSAILLKYLAIAEACEGDISNAEQTMAQSRKLCDLNGFRHQLEQVEILSQDMSPKRIRRAFSLGKFAALV